jgi:hypothetical protein
MGLHIIVKKVLGYDEDGYLLSENCAKEIEHDECRFSWDKEFVSEINKPESTFKPVYISDKMPVVSYTEKETYVRIGDFEAAKKWVDDNVKVEGNKNRLHNLLTHMENDNSIYLDFSY